MYAALLTAALAASQAPGGSAPQPGRDAGAAGARSAAGSIPDGTWMVVSMERDGRAVDAKNMTVTARDGVLSFTGGDTAGGLMRSMRLELAPAGVVRISDGATGAGGAGRGTGSGTGGTGGTSGSGTGGSDRGAGAAGAAGARTGVYVMTHDYVALSIPDAGGTGAGAGRGSGGAGGTGTGGKSGSGTDQGRNAGAGPGVSRAALTVVLHRSGTGTGGSGGGDRK